MKLSKTLAISIATVAISAASASAALMMPTQNCSYSFSQNLKMGSSGMEVMNLQKVLNMYPQTMVASTGAGSMGMETMKFGPATKAAVIKFQVLNASDVLTPAGLTRGTGNVYALTRAALNQICKGGVSTNPVTPVPGCTSTTMYSPINGQMCPVSNGNTGTVNTGTGVVSNNIPVSVLVQGQAGAKLAEFVVSGNGAVSNITLHRTGLANNSTLANVYLYDGMTRLTDASSPRTDGSISFNSNSGLFFVNGSKTITVRADIQVACSSVANVPVGCGNTSGQTVGVAFTSMTMAGGSATPVSGANGALFAISSANTATANFTNNAATVNPFVAVNTVYTINPGSVNQTLWSDSISIGVNPVKFNGMTFKMVGSAPANALANVQLYIDGVSKGTAMINNNNQYIFTMSPVTLITGSHTVELRGDIVAGASRTFYMSVERGTDVMVEDSTLPGVNVSVTTSYGGSGSALNIRNAGTITIGSVTTSNSNVTITKDTSFNNVTNLVPGASQVTIGSFKVTAYSEDVKFISLPIVLNANALTNSGSVTTLANVGLYMNGAQIGSSINPYTFTSNAGVDSTGATVNGLGSNLYIPAGQTVTVQVKADIMNSASSPFTGGTLIAKLGAGSVQGVSSSIVSVTTLTTGQTLTVGGSNPVVGKLSSAVNPNISANSNNVKIGSFQIQAGTVEGINVRQLALALGGTISNVNLISNIKLVDINGNTLATPAGVGQASQNFSVNYNVNAGQTSRVDVIADLGSITTTQTIIPTLTVTANGNTSNQNLTITGSPATGDTLTVNTVTTGVPTLSSKLNSQYVLGGATVSSVGVYNFTSTNGNSTINDLGFTVTASTGSPIASVSINGVTVAPIGTAVTFTGLNLNVPVGTNGVNYPVTINYSAAYPNAGSPLAGVLSGTTGSISLTSMKSTADGQSAVTSAPSVTTNTMTLVSTMPTVVKAGVAGSVGVNGSPQTQVKIGSIKVSADAVGDVMLGTLAYTLSAPAALSNVTVKVGGSVALDKNSVAPTNTTTTSLFGNGYRITAGQTVTFDIFADIAAVTTAGTLDASVGTAANFLWSDDVTTAGTNKAGTLLPSVKYVQ